MAMRKTRNGPGAVFPHDPLRPPPDIGHILEVLFFKCDPAPWIIIGAAGFFSMEAFWSIVSPNWKDGVKHGTGHSWLHNMKGDLEDAVREAPDWYQKGVVFGFDLLEFADFAAFFLMVGEAIGDALIGSTSLIWEFSPCNKPTYMAYYYSKTANCYNGAFLEWRECFAFNHGYTNFDTPNIGSQLEVDQGTTFRIGLKSQWVPFVGDTPRPMNTRIIDLNTDTTWKESHWDPETADHKDTSAVWIKPTTNYSSKNYLFSFQGFCPINYADLGSTCDGTQGHIAIELVTYPS